jgi:large subunit ribosomal protein L14e
VLYVADGGLVLAAVEVGRVCLKIAGREAGRRCIVVDVIDKNFVLVTGPPEVSGVRRRRTNIGHIEPTPLKIKIAKGAGDEEIQEALKKAGKLDEMKARAREIAKPSL